MARIITVSSGKGGVGKSNISVNLALELGKKHKVALFDVDMGLANINILLGLYPNYTLEHVLSGEKSLKDIIIKGFKGLDIIPGSSGIEMLANLDTDQVARLIKVFTQFNDYDFIIFDTSAGISRDVISFCLASSEVILVLTGEPTSLTDGFSLLKVLSVNKFTNPVRVIVNQCKNVERANMVYTKFKAVVGKYISMTIQPLGVLLHDPHVLEAVTKQKPFIRIFPDSMASRCIRLIADRLLSNKLSSTIEGSNFDSFWMQFLLFYKGSLKIPHRKKGDVDLPKLDTRKIQPDHAVESDRALEVPEVPKKEAVISNTHEITGMISKIAEGISDISTELKSIRQLMEKENGEKDFKTTKNRNSKNIKSNQNKQKKSVLIPLNFEALREKR